MIDDQPTLFEVARRDDREVCPGPHVLMPCMGYACGGDILTKTGGFLFLQPDNFHEIGCSDCAAFGHAALSAEIQRQQGRQA